MEQGCAGVLGWRSPSRLSAVATMSVWHSSSSFLTVFVNLPYNEGIQSAPVANLVASEFPLIQ